MSVYAMYFSPTGTTKKVVETIACEIADSKGENKEIIDFTLPMKRECNYCFNEKDIVIFGTPVYAGRVPNILLKFLGTIKGNGALAVPIVLFGNRNYDDALMELKLMLEGNGFIPIAAGAFVGEHSFSYALGAGRPDEEDISIAKDFSKKIYEKMLNNDFTSVVPRGNNPIKPYYQPKDKKGEPVDIRKVKPKVNDKCINCKDCVNVCPMGSISAEDVREYIGVCIKCGACIKKCPIGAKYYDDYNYLYHKKELEDEFERRGLVEIFI